jgi:hypothetical protein
MAQIITGVVFGIIEWMFPGSVLPPKWKEGKKR